jgi:hypothetical protein
MIFCHYIARVIPWIGIGSGCFPDPILFQNEAQYIVSIPLTFLRARAGRDVGTILEVFLSSQESRHRR